MMRPVILSSPEKLAFLLTIFCAGGSETTSSPGCKEAGAPGTPFGWGCPGGNLGRGAVRGGADSGCDCTLPGAGTPCPGSGRLGVGNRRPCGNSGTSSSSSGGGCG